MAGFVIDGHTHVFPDLDQGRTWQEAAGHAPIRSGTLDDLEPLMRSTGHDRAFVLAFPRSRHLAARLRRQDPTIAAEDLHARVAADARELNLWVCSLAARDDRFVPFVGVNPTFQGSGRIEDELDDLFQRGARGVKLLPPEMQLYANSPLLLPVYEYCARRSIPVLSQSGDGGTRPSAPDADPYGHPGYFSDVLATFPDLTLILAHMGRGHEEDVVRLMRSYPRVYTDTSLRLATGGSGDVAPEAMADLIRRMGADRVIYGSNYPLGDPVASSAAVARLPLDDEERERLLARNALEAIGDS